MRTLARLLAIAALVAPQAAFALDPARIPPITLGTGSAGDGSSLSVTANGSTLSLGAVLGAVQANTSAISMEVGRAKAVEGLLAPLANPTFTGTVTAQGITITGSGSLTVPNLLISGSGAVTAPKLIVSGAGAQISGNSTLTVPYTKVNATQHGLRASAGTLDPTWEFPGINPNGNHSTAGLTGIVAIPAGKYTGDVTWPDFGVQGIAITNNPLKSAIGVFGFGGIGVSGGMTQSFNGVATNCELGKATCADGGGYDFSHIYGAEVDLNIYTKPGGASPSGDAVGFLAMLGTSQAGLNGLSSLAAVRVATASTGKWTTAFDSFNGAATVALSVGPQLTTGNSDSQFVYFNARAGTTPRNGYLKLAPTGSFQINFPSVAFMAPVNMDSSIWMQGAIYAGSGKPIPGVSCSGAPTSSFQSINGIVTHC